MPCYNTFAVKHCAYRLRVVGRRFVLLAQGGAVFITYIAVELVLMHLSIVRFHKHFQRSNDTLFYVRLG